MIIKRGLHPIFYYYSSEILRLSYVVILVSFNTLSLPKKEEGTSLVVQWLRLHAANARGTGLIRKKKKRTHKLFLKKEGEGVCRTLGNLSQVVENFKKLRKSFLYDSSSF